MFSWANLPAEMKLTVVEKLDSDDVRSLSKADQASYIACLPSLFTTVKLSNFDAVEQFLANVPRSYCRFIQRLELNVTKTVDDGVVISAAGSNVCTEAVNALLIASPCLQELVLKTAGSLDPAIIPCFSHLIHLRDLTIKNIGDEIMHPMSERLVVSIAASIRNLQKFSIERVSRSVIHATDLASGFPPIPLVSGDDNIPEHPILGSDLYLPSLLRIPTLTHLVIRDTHLGDPRWATTPVACNIELLDVRSCCHETEEVNKACIERIMTAVGRTVNGLSIDTAVAPPPEPLPRLRKLYISEFHPVDSVIDTISNLSASPIESLSMQCFEDDVVDVCSALQEFLSLRVERGSEFFEKLSRIDLKIANDGGDVPFNFDPTSEHAEAMEELQKFCCDLKLMSKIPGTDGKFSFDHAAALVNNCSL